MRKGKATPRIVAPDPRYQELRVAKFINYLMKQGKKNIASGIFYSALEITEKKTGKPGLEVFNLAFDNAMPTLEAVRRRVSGTIRQVPMEVRTTRKNFLSIKWLIQGARKGHGRSMEEKLANELIAASKGEGNAMKTKNTSQKMAESNKAFAHLQR